MLKCTKFYFDRGSAPELVVMGSLQRSPRPLAGFKGPTSKRRRGGKGKERDGRGRKGKDREGR